MSRHSQKLTKLVRIKLTHRDRALDEHLMELPVNQGQSSEDY